MISRKRAMFASVAAVLLTAAGAATYASKDSTPENDAISDLARAKVSLVSAVGVAEQQSGGKATRAELESEDGVTAFEVEIVTPDKKVLEIKVDALTGKVLSSKEDKPDGRKHREKN